MTAEWFKSTYSGGSDDNCVEVAFIKDGVAVRDSKDPAGGVLTYTLPEWAAFLAGVKAGQFDR
jgi:hypothetical protein